MAHWRVAAATVLLTASVAGAQSPGRTLFDEVARAMGGSDRVANVQSLIVEGAGENYTLGQNPTPDGPLPTYSVTRYVRATDFTNSRWRLDQTREPRFITANTAPQRQRWGFDAVGYDITSDTTMRRSGNAQTIERRAELIYHPVGFLQAAARPGARLSTPAGGTARLLRLDVDSQTYTMVVDPRTKLPMRIERLVHNGVLGDAVLSNEFSNWKTVSGVRLPMRTLQRLDSKWALSDIKLKSARVNVVLDALAIEESVRTDPVLPAPPVSVTVDSIASGIWYVTGGTHHSVAIDLGESILLVEAPQNDERTLAVIRKVRDMMPGKPIRGVVNTHHHFDHSGGVRAAMSEGLTIFTHRDNVPFYQALSKRTFSLVPDALARNGKQPDIQAADATTPIRSNLRSVEFHEVVGSTHSGTMLLVYLPADKLVIEADLFTPQAASITTPQVAPFAKALVENIDRLKLDVDRIVPIHGRVVPMSALRAVAK